LALGDSDIARRADDVMALGYPLGQQSLKSTTGVISGREQNLIQISAPINPGNSGGPLVNQYGQVIGINSSGILEAQSVGYAIPINDLKTILPDLHTVKLLRKPFLGVLFNNATDTLTDYLGNPQPGGCYVVEVIGNSPLAKVGVKSGDMIYEINGHKIDIFGEMKLPVSEDKISVVDYVSRLGIGEKLHITVYRHGTRKEFDLTFGLPQRPAIREIFLGYEEIDYEIFGGMVVMPLTLNHLPLLGNRAPGLAKYMEAQNQSEPRLVITHIFPNCQLYRSRSLPLGSTINEINGIKVSTLEDFRNAITKNVDGKFLTIRASDNVTRKSENVLVALSMAEVIKEEPKLARDYRYPITQMAQSVLHTKQEKAPLNIDIKNLTIPTEVTQTTEKHHDEKITPAA
jgi:Trypsin-like serine proteases, typically periplasmic, contain C-terminal PDZ domain